MSSKSILLVEDESVMARLVNRFVDLSFGNKVSIDWVSRSAEGLLRLDNPIYKYDLVITDWNCPETNGGMDIVMRANKLNIPVVVYTSDIENKQLIYVDSMGIPIVDKVKEISCLIQEISHVLFE